MTQLTYTFYALTSKVFLIFIPHNKMNGKHLKTQQGYIRWINMGMAQHFAHLTTLTGKYVFVNCKVFYEDILMKIVPIDLFC